MGTSFSSSSKKKGPKSPGPDPRRQNGLSESEERQYDELDQSASFNVPAKKASFSGVSSSYEGEKNAEGEAHGVGRYTFATGETYDGEWYENSRQGQGTYTSANGNQYVGEFYGDKIHGKKQKNGSTVSMATPPPPPVMIHLPFSFLRRRQVYLRIG